MSDTPGKQVQSVNVVALALIACGVPDDDGERIVEALKALGYVIVPEKPTISMRYAAMDRLNLSWGEIGVVYRSMIAARPGKVMTASDLK